MSTAVPALRQAAVDAALRGPGKAARTTREAAFANANVPGAAAPLVAKIAQHAWRVTDEDIAAAKQAGLSDDEIFELAVCAALGQATRQLDAARAAVDAAFGETP